MNIKTRLSVQFTIIATSILLFFSVLVFFFSYKTQHSRFSETLIRKAQNNAILCINVDEVDTALLKKIHQSTILLEREEVAVTDSAYHLIYSNNIDYLKPEILSKIKPSGPGKYFSIKEKDGVCYKHIFKNKTYFSYTAAFDRSRDEHLHDLVKILAWSILFSIWLSVVFSYLFSKKALKPISDIIRSVKEINSQKLNKRLYEGKRKDEIDILSITFNEMLSNLEFAFKNQEEFVTNASHELRTPLSVMISESDYVLSKERTPQEYVTHISAVLNDLKKLNVLVTSLLELAQLNQKISFELLSVRIDEVVFAAIRQVKVKYPDRKIVPKISYPEEDAALIIKGNEGLLTIAFRNILDNACKFSSGEIDVEFSLTAGKIFIKVTDHGIGISQNEVENIFKPFSRGNNAKFIGGFGIGLSLVAKIIELHKAEISIKSNINQGTSVEVAFKKT
jgi:two-component system, OmpR family, sensor histidine kinase ArlS